MICDYCKNNGTSECANCKQNNSLVDNFVLNIKTCEPNESGEKPVPFPHYEPLKNSCISSTKDNRNAGSTIACFSEYKPMGAILLKADNRGGDEEWAGE